MSSFDKHNTAREHFTWDNIKLALEAAEEGFYIWDIRHDEIHYTARCLKMMGANQHEEAPNIFTQPELTIHEEDQAFFKQELARYLNGHSYAPMRIEIRMKKLSSQSWSWVRINGIAKRDKQRKPEKLVGVWVNITRRKTAELSASQDRDLFKLLLEYVPDSIYFKNRDSRFILANAATAKKLNVAIPADLIGKTDAAFFSEKLAKVSRQEEREIMETGRPLLSKLHTETWGHEPNQKNWSINSKFPWYDRSGKIQGIIGISSDVTELKQREIEAKEKNKALEKELNLARELQFSLLPYQIPSRTVITDGIVRQADFHHIFAPCEAVAGDWFHVFHVGDSGVSAIVCDVMGHGVPSALIATMMRGLMEQLTPEAGDPGQFLTSLNRQLHTILHRANINMFATAVYVYLDLKTGVLSVSSAGHPAPILKKANGETIKLTLARRSMALGFLANTTYQNTEFELENGSRLLLYTDGLIEARDESGEEMGINHLIEHYNQCKPGNTQEFVHEALTCVARYTKCANLADDICMLGVAYSECPELSDF